MTTVSANLAASASITVSTALNSLTTGSAAQLGSIDNSTNLYLDALVSIYIAVGTVASPKYINVWAAASEDGTTFTGNSATTDAYTGTAGSITLGSPTSFFGPFFFPTQQSSVTAQIIIPSMRDLFGGLILPRKWGLIVENQSGASFASSGHSATYSGVKLTNA